MRNQLHVAFIHQFYEKWWNAFDKGWMPRLLTEDVSLRGSLGQTAKAHAAFAEYVDFVRRAFPDFHNEVVEILSEGAQAVLQDGLG